MALTIVLLGLIPYLMKLNKSFYPSNYILNPGYWIKSFSPNKLENVLDFKQDRESLKEIEDLRNEKVLFVCM